jgi:pre-mRNA-splicing factor ATP-dependent RNA helicase DHX16
MGDFHITPTSKQLTKHFLSSPLHHTNTTKVSDNALTLFGISDRSIVDYIIATARSAKSPAKLLNNLKAADLPDNDKSRQFVNALFNRIPRAAPSVSSSAAKAAELARKAEERERVAMMKKSQEFQLVLDDADEGRGGGGGDVSVKKDKKKEKKIRKREDDDKAWEDDGEGNRVVKRTRVVKGEMSLYGDQIGRLTYNCA